MKMTPEKCSRCEVDNYNDYFTFWKLQYRRKNNRLKYIPGCYCDDCVFEKKIDHEIWKQPSPPPVWIQTRKLKLD